MVRDRTPLHIAAELRKCKCIQKLVIKRVTVDSTNICLHVKHWCGLWVADRSETARLLLEVDDPAPAGVEDISGQAAIVWMITKMPPVVSILVNNYSFKYI